MNKEESRRERILQSALQNFINDGYDRTTMQQIATDAGVGKGTPYEYFSSKEALFSEVILSEMEEIKDILLQPLQEGTTFYEQIEEIYKRHLQLYFTKAEIREFMVNDLGRIPKAVHHQFEQIQKDILVHVEELIRMAIKRGEILSSIHTGVLAITLLQGMLTIYHYKLKDGETYEMIIQEQLQMFFHGIKK